MLTTFDPRKQADTLANRGLDFDDARHVFAGAHLTIEDDRRDYGEVRWQSIGRLNDNLVMVVWTQRGTARHIISMRKCNERERRRYLDRQARS